MFLDENSPGKEDVVLVEEDGEETNKNGIKSDITWPAEEAETQQTNNQQLDESEKTENEKELSSEIMNQSDSKTEKEDEFNDESFHCRDLLHMHFDSLDPSLALGFICTCEDDFNDLIVQLKV